MSLVTTHVLDAAAGKPAAGIGVKLEKRDGAWESVATGRTDDDGRVRDLGPETLAAGVYRLVFDTEAYQGADGFFRRSPCASGSPIPPRTTTSRSC